MLRNQRFCSFVSFLIGWLTFFINKTESPTDLTTFMISSISSFEIINIVRFAKSEGRVADRITF